MLEPFEPAPVYGFLPAGGERILDLETEINVAYVLADDLDVRGASHSQTMFMSECKKSDVHRIESHHLGSDGIDRYAVTARDDIILDMRLHDARPGTVTGKGPVGQTKDTGVYFLLDLEKVNEGLMYDGMGPMTVVIQ